MSKGPSPVIVNVSIAASPSQMSVGAEKVPVGLACHITVGPGVMARHGSVRSTPWPGTALPMRAST